MADISEIIEQVLLSRKWPDSAAALHGAAIKAFRAYGCLVNPEYRMYGHGRIDLVIQYLGQKAAIEFDTRKPRAKSIRKLRIFDGYSVIALRGRSTPCPEGIDALITMPIRPATKAERKDKRTVNRP